MVVDSRLQNIKPGDGSSGEPQARRARCYCTHLKPASAVPLEFRHGGAPPFMSLTQDPAVYERFEKSRIVHGCAYSERARLSGFIEWELSAP